MTQTIMAWGDFETTGLDPIHDIVLEIGLRLTDVEGNTLARTTELIWTPDWRSRLVRNEFVFNMHQKSGLVHDLEDLSGSATRVLQLRENVSKRLVKWMKDQLAYFKVELGTLPFAGNSVALDKMFMQFHMPEMLPCWHYRIIDVSSTREQVRLINPKLFAKIPNDAQKAHRPQADIDSSITLWKWLVDNAFWNGDDTAYMETS